MKGSNRGKWKRLGGGKQGRRLELVGMKKDGINRNHEGPEQTPAKTNSGMKI